MAARLAFVALAAALALFVALPVAAFVANSLSSVAGTLETISEGVES